MTNPRSCCGHTTNPMRCDEEVDEDGDETCESPATLRCHSTCNRCLCELHRTRMCLDGTPHRAEEPTCVEAGCDERARRVCVACGAAVCMRHAVKEV